MRDKRTENIARKYLELRYQLLAYLCTLFEESSHTASSILRPLRGRTLLSPLIFSIFMPPCSGNLPQTIDSYTSTRSA